MIAAVHRWTPWPLPALLAWAAGWALALALRLAGVAAPWDLAAGALAGAALATANRGLLRRGIAALGFPASALLLAGTAAQLSPVFWLAALLPLVLIYPLRAWRDAPFFPTPARALQDLPRVVPRAPTRVLDAGCGLGHGLAALRRAFPHAQLHGVEWSAPMAWFTACRFRAASVRRADMWAKSWADYDLVYLFQRPETMPRAWAKATAEMRRGAWLVSLEFAVPAVVPHAALDAGGGRQAYVYRVSPARGA